VELVAGACEGDRFVFHCASICPATAAIVIEVSGYLFFYQLQATQRRSQLMAKRRKMGKMNVIGPAFSHQIT
jgi:hypothetical protein